MAAFTAFAGRGNAAARSVCRAADGLGVRRQVSQEAGRALEILGHAIEYLFDEHVHEYGTFDPSDPRLDAIALLMATNRAVYFSCPETHSLYERFVRWLSRFAVQP